jgi:hypothetical protein
MRGGEGLANLRFKIGNAASSLGDQGSTLVVVHR